MITQTHALLYQLIEDAMALKPRVRVKAQGIPMAVTTPKPKPTKKGAKK